MKKHLLLIVSVLLLVSCSQQPIFTINGTIEGAEEGKILLQKRDKAGYVVMDSVDIIGGAFTITGSLEYPEMVYLSRIGERGRMMFFLENSEITINTYADSLHKGTVTGSIANDEYNGYQDALSEIGKEMSELNKPYREAMEEGDEETIKEIMDKVDVIRAKQKQYQFDFIREDPTSYVGAFVLQSLAGNIEDVVEFEELANNFDSSLDSVSYIKDTKEKIEVAKKTAIGQPAPDFTMNDPEGNPISLSSLQGNYLLVDFWAAWCGPCRRENPNVVEAYKKYHDKGFDILGVSFDRPGEKDKWVQAIEDDGLTWYHISELKYWDNTARYLYGINGIPANVLLDADGIIIAKNLRGEKLHEKLAELLD
ncbi:redoxin domain-containing protein [Bacteroidota bacterium]